MRELALAAERAASDAFDPAVILIVAIGGTEVARLDALHVRGGRGSLAWTADGRYLVARCADLVVLDGVKCQPIGTWSPIRR